MYFAFLDRKFVKKIEQAISEKLGQNMKPVDRTFYNIQLYLKIFEALCFRCGKLFNRFNFSLERLDLALTYLLHDINI